MPALCVPLNGVTVLAQPAATASAGELNHRPRCQVWIGFAMVGFVLGGVASAGCTGAGTVADPGATMKVSTLNRPTKSPTPLPILLVRISPWYQDKPNGLLGTWMIKKS